MRNKELQSETARRAPIDNEGRTTRHFGRAKDDFDYLEWREWERKAARKDESRVATAACR
ncbi:MAG TPA: hypothetical protein VIY90_03415 [Steroidobacteraceae bacterium]